MANYKSTIDLTRFVAIGDSITAGYADGALYYEGQQNTYPNLIAKQYHLIKPISFKQPVVDPQSVGIGFLGRSRLVLVPATNSKPIRSAGLSYMAETGDGGLFSKNIYSSLGPFNNMAVPGAKTSHLMFPKYGDPKLGPGNYNPFFMRMASDPEQASILSDIMAVDPTFFTLFIGNNDVLAYAMSGGITETITPLKGKLGEGFYETLNYIIETLTANGAKGILATIPNIISIPFFNTIPYNGLSVSKKEAELLNEKYINDTFNFKSGTNNTFLIEDNIKGKSIVRRAEKGDLILSELMLDELKEDYLKGFAPIPKKYTLTKLQVLLIEDTIRHYNDAIKIIAKEKNLGLVDLNHLLKNSKPDRTFDPKTRRVYYKETGVFSLDGMHINSLGQALLANEFIKVIFKKYSLKIPRVPIFRFRKKQRIY